MSPLDRATYCRACGRLLPSANRAGYCLACVATAHPCRVAGYSGRCHALSRSRCCSAHRGEAKRARRAGSLP